MSDRYLLVNLGEYADEQRKGMRRLDRRLRMGTVGSVDPLQHPGEELEQYGLELSGDGYSAGRVDEQVGHTAERIRGGALTSVEAGQDILNQTDGIGRLCELFNQR